MDLKYYLTINTWIEDERRWQDLGSFYNISGTGVLGLFLEFSYSVGKVIYQRIYKPFEICKVDCKTKSLSLGMSFLA